MDKKNRTGLQSKISHIFAGVPVPKKKKPLSDNSDSEEKDSINEIDQYVTDDVVIEDNVDIQEDENPDLKEDINEVTFSEEVLEDTKRDFDKKEELKNIVVKPLGYVEKTTIDKPAELKKPDEQIPVSPAISKDIQSQEQQSSQDIKPKFDKKVAPKISLKEIIDDKSKTSIDSGSEIPGTREPIRSRKPLVSDVPEIKKGRKKVARLPKKALVRPKAKKLKSQSNASQSRQKFMVALIVIFSILLVVVMLRNYGFFDSGTSTTGNIEGMLVQTPIQANTGEYAINWPEPPIYQDGLRDPMGTVDTIINDIIGNDHPDLNVSGTSTVEGGNYKVTVVNNPLPFEINSNIKDNKGRDVKVIDIGLNRVVFEMGSMLWTYDLRTKKWIQNDSQDVLGD